MYVDFARKNGNYGSFVEMVTRQGHGGPSARNAGFRPSVVTEDPVRDEVDSMKKLLMKAVNNSDPRAAAAEIGKLLPMLPVSMTGMINEAMNELQNRHGPAAKDMAEEYYQMNKMNPRATAEFAGKWMNENPELKGIMMQGIRENLPAGTARAAEAYGIQESGIDMGYWASRSSGRAAMTR